MNQSGTVWQPSAYDPSAFRALPTPSINGCGFAPLVDISQPVLRSNWWPSLAQLGEPSLKLRSEVSCTGAEPGSTRVR